MDRKKFQSVFYDIDEFLTGAICDDIELCEEIDYPVYTRYFYPPNFWSRLDSLNMEVKFSFIGINNNCEKRMVGIYPKDFDTDMLNFPVKYFKIVNGSKFKELEHKHYLGSIMSLGLKREILGDLIVKDGICYGIINEELFTFLKENLNLIGKIPIEVEEITSEDIPEIEFKELVESVASLRLDVITAALGNFSRNSAIEVLESGDVALNYNVDKDKSKLVKEKDIISIRRKGKFLVDSVLGESKKGKIRVLIKKFS
ncbi:RNA-binding protein [Fusobacterium sp.]|uniref:YlmH family RNA-binding protein n=1 Tax=Fusobacterium sp. TaxID=68766 RepID=UPI00290477DE|nr:YlmH/Sll1252 family protein [Fusobacterium sp.]MDU1911246.1 YlmH/Sll1252 family protein [Fusobacterium sp.]